MKHLSLSLAGLLAWPLSLLAQETPPPPTYRSLNSGLSLAYDPGTSENPNPAPFRVSWYAHSGRNYFLEGTDDLEHGPWTCLQNAFNGHFAAEYVQSVDLSFTTGAPPTLAPRYFVRVRYTEGRRSGLDFNTSYTTDTDHDGASDYAELSGVPPTYPFGSADTDADNLPDDWELRRFVAAPPAVNQDEDPANDVGPLHFAAADPADPDDPASPSAYTLHRRDWLRGVHAAYGPQFFWFERFYPDTRTALLGGDEGGSLLATYADDDLSRLERIVVYPRTQWQTQELYAADDARRTAPPQAVYDWIENAAPALSGFSFTAEPGHEVIDHQDGTYSVGPLDGTSGRDLLRYYDSTRRAPGAPRPDGATVPMPFRRVGSGASLRRVPAELAITSQPPTQIGRDRFPLVLRDMPHVMIHTALDFDGNGHPRPGSAEPGWLQASLDAEGLPQAIDDPERYPSSGPSDINPLMFRSPLTFAKWFRDDSAQGYTIPGILAAYPDGFTPPDQPLTYRYGVYSQGFYPHANDVGTDNDWDRGKFTTELHARLDYTLDTQLYLASNDDCWVFINGELLSNFDLGGIPMVQSTASVRFGDLLAALDAATRTRLGLGADTGSCRLDLFHADRMTGAFEIYGTAELRLLSTTPLRPVYCYQVIAESAEVRPLHYEFATDPGTGAPLAPAGMTIHPETGKIFWDLYQNPAASPDTYPVVVRVSDSAGNSDTQSFTLTVSD